MPCSNNCETLDFSLCCHASESREETGTGGEGQGMFPCHLVLYVCVAVSEDIYSLKQIGLW